MSKVSAGDISVVTNCFSKGIINEQCSTSQQKQLGMTEPGRQKILHTHAEFSLRVKHLIYSINLGTSPEENDMRSKQSVSHSEWYS